VADTGIGIEPDLLARIFDPFEQGPREVTRKFGGLGVGLAVSKSLAEAHGGTLTAWSEGRGKGAVFTLQLPLADRRPAPKH
jgi:signal transduction histidine kinase